MSSLRLQVFPVTCRVSVCRSRFVWSRHENQDGDRRSSKVVGATKTVILRDRRCSDVCTSSIGQSGPTCRPVSERSTENRSLCSLPFTCGRVGRSGGQPTCGGSGKDSDFKGIGGCLPHVGLGTWVSMVDRTTGTSTGKPPGSGPGSPRDEEQGLSRPGSRVSVPWHHGIARPRVYYSNKKSDAAGCGTRG